MDANRYLQNFLTSEGEEIKDRILEQLSRFEAAQKQGRYDANSLKRSTYDEIVSGPIALLAAVAGFITMVMWVNYPPVAGSDMLLGFSALMVGILVGLLVLPLSTLIARIRYPRKWRLYEEALKETRKMVEDEVSSHPALLLALRDSSDSDDQELLGKIQQLLDM